MAKRNSPGCACCARPCPLTCWTVSGCGRRLPGATIRVYQDGSPSTILTSGTTDANGELCLDLTTWIGLTLRYSVTGAGSSFIAGDYSFGTTNPCGRRYTAALTPGTVSGSGTSGKLTVTLVDEDGFPVTSGTAYVVDPLDPLNFTNSATMGAVGVVTFTGVATGVSRFFRGPNLQNFPEFTLTCEGTATAKYADLGIGQEWNLTSIPCPSTSARCCCTHCFANTLPTTLYVDGITRAGLFNNGGGWTSIASCSDVRLGILFCSPTGASIWSGTDPCSFIVKDDGTVYPRPTTESGLLMETSLAMTCQPNESGTPWIYLRVRKRSYKTVNPDRGTSDHFWLVPAASITCDPVLITFNVPSIENDPAIGFTRFGIFGAETLLVSDAP